MAATPPDDTRARTSGDRPPWIEEAADPTWWDLAFGTPGDTYFEWVATPRRRGYSLIDEPWLIAPLDRAS